MQLKVTMKLCSGNVKGAKYHRGSIPGAVIYCFGSVKMPAYGW